MFNIFFEDESIKSLKKFIDSYKRTFIRMIEDSGLEVENYLINSYIELGNKLYSTIVSEIKNNFQNDVLFGRNEKYLVLSVNKFRLFVYYEENQELKERYILDIEFFKK
ncbi:MAG: hypothetical protein PHE25_05030 [Candidatus Gracilibacteria bacterium]|nr:hypothetical protein [Candidatus Gracilibacteria bacterium]